MYSKQLLLITGVRVFDACLSQELRVIRASNAMGWESGRGDRTLNFDLNLFEQGFGRSGNATDVQPSCWNTHATFSLPAHFTTNIPHP